jgi:NTP pyrophosphatase (non-canonical NTP hydrolase)
MDNKLDFDSYQQFTQSLAVYNRDVYAFVENVQGDKDGVHMPWTYPATALGEEAGEVLGKIAKFVRKYGTDTYELRELVKKELGDVLYQLSQTAKEFDLTLQEVAEGNVEKLTDRKERGVLIGEGDER